MTNQNVEPGWNFDNSYARLPKTFYSKINPTPVKDPKLIVLNEPLANDLGINSQFLQSAQGIEVLGGNHIPEGAAPLAQAYAGHQFGYFNMLGDGRAILLGEQITPQGERFDIQLKGPGRTPYSRGGDGRAALGPMLREYIMSEAMHALGIPTSRSLAVVTTGETIIRETELPGAILTRVASSHIRVGTFQFAAQWGNVDELSILADYTIERHFPELKGEKNPYLSLLQEVIKRQAMLIAKWQLVGFIHGVMNTDNMTISGETIDYGPCAFMDTYDPTTVFSSIDREGRYAYGNQPNIGVWNLARLAEALLPLFDDNDEKAVTLAQDKLSDFAHIYRAHWLEGMRGKLGLYTKEEGDQSLIDTLLKMMHEHQADYTHTFTELTYDKQETSKLFGAPEFTEWKTLWQARQSRQPESKLSPLELMRKSNPVVIPRNHRVEEALEAAVEKGDFRVLEKLLNVLSDPFTYTEDKEEYCTQPEPSNLPYRTYCGT
jgi:serine/tyrosine/threonine adenylyltransferase